MADELIINMSDPEKKAGFIDRIRFLQGVYRFNWCRHQPRHTDKQRKFYWAAFCKPLAKFRQDQGESWTKDKSHELFKWMFLREPVVDEQTGEVLYEKIPSITELDIEEFCIYLDKIGAWLFEKLGWPMPDPAEYRGKELA